MEPPPRSQACREGAGLVLTSPSEAPAPLSTQLCGLVSDREALQHRQVALWCFNTGFNTSLNPQNPQVQSSHRSCPSKEEHQVTLAGGAVQAGSAQSETSGREGEFKGNRQLRKFKG